MTHHESIQTREITAMGIRTRVLESGPASDEAVVFIHGGPGSADDWDYFLPRVAEFSRAVAVDLVGFGQADKPPRLGYSGPVWATFVQNVLNELRIRRFYRTGSFRTTSLGVGAVRRLDRPALVVWGARNRFVPVRHADDQRRSFPRAEIVVLPDEGHYVHLRAPEVVAERLLPFLHGQLGVAPIAAAPVA